MTLEEIAKLAGVSTSTVSRVIHNHPQVTPQTATSVRSVMDAANFKPSRRTRRKPESPAPAKTATSAMLLIIGTPSPGSATGFERLLKGVSTQAAETDIDLEIQFICPTDTRGASLNLQHTDGILIHGDPPAPQLQRRLERIPTVWLMANRVRPAWGDQVLPDNTAIGELAAAYLTGRGHRELAICSIGWDSWSMEVRSRAFCRAARDAGARAVSIEPGRDQSDQATDLHAAAGRLVDELLAVDPRPTGLFIAEDRQVVPIATALASHGLSTGSAGHFEIISCNNEPSHLMGLNPQPATIDIQAELIGQRGVEQLRQRLETPGSHGRVRTLIEPIVVEAVPHVRPCN